MSDKYISQEPDGIAHCPFCRGIVIKNFIPKDMKGDAEFTIRCPHCQKNMSINLKDGKIIVKDSN